MENASLFFSFVPVFYHGRKRNAKKEKTVRRKGRTVPQG